MIVDISEAKSKVPASSYNRYSNIVVVEDGTVFCSNDASDLQSKVDNNNCFVVKGDLVKTVSKSKSKGE